MTLPLSREQRAMTHVAYEVDMCAESAIRLLAPGLEGYAENAYLECMLLHARALEEFLVLKSRNWDDLRRTDFAPDWKPAPKEAVGRLDARRPTINKHLAHLTWARVDDPAKPDWPFVEVAEDVVAIAHAWVEHVTTHEGKRLSDPDIKALPVWTAVSLAEKHLAGARQLPAGSIMSTTTGSDAPRAVLGDFRPLLETPRPTTL